MINYIQDVEKGVTIATLEGTSNDAIDRLLKMNHGQITDEARRLAKMRDSFKTKVTCHPSDTFDAETGKRLAKQKLLNEYHRVKQNALIRAAAELTRNAENADYLIDKEDQFVNMPVKG